MKNIIRQLSQFFVILLGLSVAAGVASAQTDSAFFSFGSVSSQPTEGKTFTIPVVLDTGTTEVAGADAVIRYDPDALAVVRVDPGELFDNYPQNDFDLSGNINISGVMSESTASFSGRGIFGTITFRGESAGSTTLSYTCTANEGDTDIFHATSLEDIIDCDRTSSTTVLVAAAPTPVGQPNASPTAVPDELTKGGTTEISILLAGMGLILVTLGGILQWQKGT